MRAIGTFGLRRLIVLGCVVGLAATFCGTATATNYLLDPNFSGADGTAGEGYTLVYKTINSALAGMPAGTSAATPNILYIEPGTYNTAATTGVSLSDSRSNIALIGLTGNADDVVITSTLDSAYNPGSGALGTTGSATLQLKGNNVSAENITFANSTDTPYIISPTGNHFAVTPAGVYPTSGTAQTATQPAVALLLQGDEQAFQNVKVLGYQDTLYMKGGRVYFNNSYVSGDDDFMFANSTVVFKNSTLNIDGDHSGGAMTAASTDKRTSNGFVFLNSTVTANSVHGNTVIDSQNAANASGPAAGSMYLGRPWGWTQAGGDASTVFINTILPSAIKGAGWLAWDSTETNASNGKNGGNPGEDSRYAEYNSTSDGTNPVSVSTRVSWSHQLTAGQAAAYTVANIFSPEGTGVGQYPWYGKGYPAGDASNPGTGVADPNDPNYSWPAFWGDRNSNNETPNDNVLNNPAGYTNPTWVPSAVSWDPDAQLALVPEPGSAALLGLGGFMCWRVRRRKQSSAR